MHIEHWKKSVGFIQFVERYSSNTLPIQHFIAVFIMTVFRETKITLYKAKISQLSICNSQSALFIAGYCNLTFQFLFRPICYTNAIC